MAPSFESASVGEVTQLLQEWETVAREGVSGDRLIATLKKLADVVERETDNYFKQVFGYWLLLLPSLLLLLLL